jgi:hypothetical protein
VIAHDGQGFAFIDHGPDDFKHLANLRSPVDEVAQEDHFSFGVLVDTLGLPIAESFEKLHQFIGVTVNVPDQVVRPIRFHPQTSPYQLLETLAFKGILTNETNNLFGS